MMMKQMRKMNVTEIERAINSINGSFALESLNVSEHDIQNGRNILSGKISVDDAIAREIEMMKMDGLINM